MLSVLWGGRIRMYSNLGPDGFIGIFSPWAVGPWALLLMENVLHSQGQSNFPLPGFQFGAGYAVLAPATTWLLLWVFDRVRSERFLFIMAALLTVNAVGWAVTWLPHMSNTWVRTPRVIAQEMYRLNDVTPRNVQFIASQGVIGAVAARPYVRHFVGQGGYNYWTDRVRVVILPYSGIETSTVEESADAIAALLDHPWYETLRASNDFWMFDYKGGKPPKYIFLGFPRLEVPAVAFATDVGQRILGPSAATSVLRVDGQNPAAGYLLKWAYFRRSPGHYRVYVTLRAPSPVFIDLRDATKDLSLVTTTYQDPALRRIDFSLSLPYWGGQNLFAGSGPFISPPWQESPFDELELRIRVPAHAHALVTTVGVTGVDVTRRCAPLCYQPDRLRQAIAPGGAVVTPGPVIMHRGT
ncbi:MAG: hypothetical protein JO060_06935 [Candidatus Eremiobacteraeota bacterium]|nr:hypothetical protein [Candidatus Eremiobacteraeota bacterium]